MSPQSFPRLIPLPALAQLLFQLKQFPFLIINFLFSLFNSRPHPFDLHRRRPFYHFKLFFNFKFILDYLVHFNSPLFLHKAFLHPFHLAPQQFILALYLLISQITLNRRVRRPHLFILIVISDKKTLRLTRRPL